MMKKLWTFWEELGKYLKRGVREKDLEKIQRISRKVKVLQYFRTIVTKETLQKFNKFKGNCREI